MLVLFIGRGRYWLGRWARRMNLNYYCVSSYAMINVRLVKNIQKRVRSFLKTECSYHKLEVIHILRT